MKKLLSILVLCLMTLGLFSCTTDLINPTLKLNEKKISLAVGEKYKVSPKLTGTSLSELEYHVADETIVSVSNGVVTALASGTTIVTLSLPKYPSVKSVSLQVVVGTLPTLEINGSNKVELGKSVTLVANTNYEGERVWTSSNEEVAKVVDGVVTGISEGVVTITLRVGSKETTFELTVYKKPFITVDGLNKMTEGDKQTLKISTNIEELQYVSSDENVVVVNNKEVVAKKAGSATITISGEGVSVTFDILVKKAINLNVTGDEKVFVGKSFKLVIDTDYEGELEYSSSDDAVATVENGVVTGVSEGSVTITVKADDVEKEITVLVEAIPDVTKPEFKFADGFKKDTFVNWGKEFNKLEGITAFDDVDGDITNDIEVTGEVDNKSYGFYDLTYEVSDKSGNTQSFTRKIEVVWNYDVKFIGHAGSYYGKMNSEAAILYAVQVLKYQAIEIDIKQTKDGVFVLSHDNNFGDYDIASTPWSTFENYTVTESRSAGYPAQNGSITDSPYTTKLCTLARYLEICKQYNVKAVIELKSSAGITNTDQSRMPALMAVIEQYNMVDDVIFLGSQYNCLIWTRQNGYSNVECQYLVNSCESEDALKRCIDYDLDISINVTSSYSNSDEWLARYKEAGRKISTYTFTQYVNYDVVQTWIDKGVDYVTCDWHVMSELRLPESSHDPFSNVYHKVRFLDYDGTLLKEVDVKEGRTASSPLDPKRSGYTFTGWDKSFKTVLSDLEVKATYEINNYTITYDANTTKIIKSAFESKQAFLDELYADMYSFFKQFGSKLPGVTVEGNKVTISKNNKTVSFSNATELFAIDISTFELTVSNYMFKPLVRNNEGIAEIEADENYFFNNNLYRVKYQDMDQYLYYCMVNAYSAYNRTYTPTSAGKIQIFYRFHQWAKGTKIATLDAYPAVYKAIENTDIIAVVPNSPLSYTVEESIVLPKATSNYTFLGWFIDRECTQAIDKIEKGMTGNIVLYAKWDYTPSVVEYNVNYVLDGGENPTGAPVKYVEGEGLLALPVPVKAGFTFLGWFIEDQQVTKISELSTGDITLTAKWQEEIIVVGPKTLEVGEGKEYATIATALEDANEGDTIVLSPGTYNESITISKGIYLVGPNKEISAVDGTRNQEAILTEKVNIADGVKDLVIDGIKFTTNAGIGFLSASNIYIQNCILEKVSASSSNDGSIGFKANASNVHFINNMFTFKTYRGIRFETEINDLFFVGNKINDSGSCYDLVRVMGVATGKFEFIDNSFGSCTQSSVQVAKLSKDIQVLFENNKFKGAANTCIDLRESNINSGDKVTSKITIIYNEFRDSAIGDAGWGVIRVRSANMTMENRFEVVVNYNKFINCLTFSSKGNYYIDNAGSGTLTNYVNFDLNYSDLGLPQVDSYWAENTNASMANWFASESAYEQAYAVYLFEIRKTYHKISYILDGGLLPDGHPVEFAEGEGLANLPIPTKNGYEFLGWTLDENSIDYIKFISDEETSDVTLYAHFKEIKDSLKVGENSTYLNIQSAFNDAVDGDVIEIEQGEYDFKFVINKSVTFKGAGKDKTILKVAQDQAMNLAAQNIVFDSLTLRGTTGGTYFATSPSAQNFTVRNCRIEEMNSFIRVQTATAGDAVVVMENNEFVHIGQFIIWMKDGYQAKELRFIGNTVKESGSVVNASAGMIRVREGKAYIYNNTFIGDLTSIGGYFEADAKADTMEVKFNKFVNVTKYVYQNSSPKPIVFDKNLYITNDAVLSAPHSNVKGGDVKADEIIASSESELLQFYNDFVNGSTGGAVYSRITYELDGGTLLAPLKYKEGKEFELLRPVREGYRFLGWTLVNGSNDFIEVLDSSTKGDVIIYAIWEQIVPTEYSITYIYENAIPSLVPCSSLEQFTKVFFDELYAWAVKENLTTRSYDDFKDECLRLWGRHDGTYGEKFNEAPLYLQDSDEEQVEGYFFTCKENFDRWYPVLLTLESVVKEINSGQSALGSSQVGLLRLSEFLLQSASYMTASRTKTLYSSITRSVELPVKYTSGSVYELPGLIANNGVKFLGWTDQNGKEVSFIDAEMYGDLILTAHFADLVLSTGFEVTNKPTKMNRLEQLQLKWAFTPADATVKSLKFKSSNPAVLSVSEDGILNALKTGVATISIEVVGNNSLNTSFDVVVVVDTFIDAYFDTTPVVEIDNTIQIISNVIEGTGKVLYKSLDENIATVDANGLVTTHNPGYTSIMCYLEEDSDVNLSVGLTVISVEDSELFAIINEAHNKEIYVTKDLNVAYAYLTDVYVSASDLLFNFDYKQDETSYLIPTSKTVNRPGTLCPSVEFITVHYTAGTPSGSNGAANASYFRNLNSSTSAQFCVGNDGIFMVVPDGEVAYHAGDGTGVKFEWINTGVMATENVKPVWSCVQDNNSSTGYYFTLNGQKTNIPVPMTGVYSDGSPATLVNPESKFTFFGPSWKVVNGVYYMGTTWACFTQVREGRISSRGGNNNSVGIETACNKGSDLWLTYQMTSQLVARLLTKYNLDTTRVVGHNAFSGKDCPQTLLANNGELWYKFMESVEAEYKLYNNMTKDGKYKITCKSNNPDILADNGRIINLPLYTTTVSYTVTITDTTSGVSRSATYASVVHGQYTM